MSRQDAFDSSLALANTMNIGPSEYSQAATFGSDNKAQNYIELDAGGSKAFIEMLDKDIYKAYTWKVRHYKENEVNEAWFTFSPEGELYGFHEKLFKIAEENIKKLEINKYNFKRYDYLLKIFDKADIINLINSEKII